MVKEALGKRPPRNNTGYTHGERSFVKEIAKEQHRLHPWWKKPSTNHSWKKAPRNNPDYTQWFCYLYILHLLRIILSLGCNFFLFQRVPRCNSIADLSLKIVFWTPNALIWSTVSPRTHKPKIVNESLYTHGERSFIREITKEQHRLQPWWKKLC